MLETIVFAALIVLFVVAVVLAYAATKPDCFRVERATRIQAPREKIAPLIHDFRRWSAWSPYERLDPGMKRRYSGADAGRGAVYEWDSATKVGAGRMEITEVAPEQVTIDLTFIRPFQARNVAQFTFAPRDGATDVTWATYGPSPFTQKVMQCFISLDRLLGRDFELGLARLKNAAEK
jgi:hypothetical protein